MSEPRTVTEERTRVPRVCEMDLVKASGSAFMTCRRPATASALVACACPDARSKALCASCLEAWDRWLVVRCRRCDAVLTVVAVLPL